MSSPSALTLPVAIIGSGPAGLMAAHVVASAGYRVTLFEKRASAGRKILIAGSSGLNISFDSPLSEFIQNYSGPVSRWKKTLNQFSPQDWIQFIQSLGLETFLGTSGRYFVRGMKGSTLLKSWSDDLKRLGVEFVYNQDCTSFNVSNSAVKLEFRDPVLSERSFSAVCFCLGGASWEKVDEPVRWPELFKNKGLRFEEFQPANSGFKVEWPEAFLKEAEGLPLKSIVLSTRKGSRAGELVITKYGLEGTPIYALGEKGSAFVDLKPAHTALEILKKLGSSKENLSPIRRVKKYLNLSPAALALVFHLTPKDILADAEKLVGRIKKFPITLREPQPLEESISSSGGLVWDELDESQMIIKYPAVFAAGEMLNWHAPTGGFLIQGCVSQGYAAGKGIVQFLERSSKQ